MTSGAMEVARRLFQERVPTIISALETAVAGIETGDPECNDAVRRIAHMLKGSAGMVGYREIGDAAAAIEGASVPVTRESIENLVKLLKHVLVEAGAASRLILVVDDDPVTSALMSETLRGSGWEVMLSETAARAEEVLAQSQVALVILDLHLPDRDGRSLLMNLRRSPGTAALPIIVVTARMGAQPRTECLALGATDYLEKPFEPAALSAAVGMALARARSGEDALLDPLTGLGNRARLSRDWTLVAAQAMRSRDPIAVGLVDLDRFKAINDLHGHAVGDEVLRRFGRTLAHLPRRSDIVGRWGGEEFALILPMTDSDGGVRVLESLLAEFRDESFTGADGKPFHVTFSAGVIAADPAGSLELAIAAADIRLYEAKSAGRARVVAGGEADRMIVRPCLLIVEDDETVVTILENLLGAEAQDVICCRSGEDAEAFLATGRRVDLVLLDVRLPGMSGLELLDRIRQHPVHARAPVMILSSLGTEAEIVSGFEHGADDYVVKPFYSAELLVRVRNLLRR